MKSMAKMKYHYGLKVRIYPSDKQKQIIKLNSDASRFIYNEMVAIIEKQCVFTLLFCKFIL